MRDSTQEPKIAKLTDRLKKLLEDTSKFVDTASDKEKETVLAVLEDRRLLALLRNRRPEDRRKQQRKACSMDIDYATWQGAFNATVQNISDGGMAIETDTVLSAGQEITVSVFPPNRRESVRITAEIVWSKPGAVGLRFVSLNEELKQIIEAL